MVRIPAMDNLAHTLAGLVLARTRLGKLVPRASLWLVVGANVPDVDILARLWGGKQAYLEYHRGITHSIVGIALQALLLAAVLHAWHMRGSGALRPRVVLAHWLAVFGAGSASHPLLDACNTYGWRPYLPFDARWIYGDMLFIVDPWLWWLLCGAALLGGPATRRARAWSVALFALASAALAGSARTPDWFWAPWLGAWALLLGLDRLAFPRAHVHATLGMFLTLLAMYLGWMAHASESARTAALAWAARTSEVGSVHKSAACPLPADPTRFEVLLQTADATWALVVRGAEVEPAWRKFDDPRERELLERAWNAPACQGLRSFARFPVGFVSKQDGQTWVQWTDARYAREVSLKSDSAHGQTGTWCSAEVRVDMSPLEPARE